MARTVEAEDGSRNRCRQVRTKRVHVYKGLTSSDGIAGTLQRINCRLNILDALRTFSPLEESAVFFLHYFHCRRGSVDGLGGDRRGYRVSPCGELSDKSSFISAPSKLDRIYNILRQ